MAAVSVSALTAPVRHRLVRLWLPVVLYMGTIFYLSSLSDPPTPPADLSDKPSHAIAYSGLSVLLVRAHAGGLPARIAWRSALFAVVVATLYGLTDEYHQLFVPGRSAEWRDLVADFTGAVIGAAACWACGIILVRSDV